MIKCRFFFIIIQSVLIFPPGPLYADQITLAADRWYPYNGEPGDTPPGYMIEIARIALEKKGHIVSYKIMPWERALSRTREGSDTCLIGPSKDDAEGFIFPDIHQGVFEELVYKLHDDPWEYSGPQSFEGKRLGVIQGYIYADDITVFLADREKSKLVHRSTGKYALEQNLLALKEGKLDLVLGSRQVVNYRLKKQQWQAEIVEGNQTSVPVKLYIACSPAIPQSGEYVALISATTKKLRQSGELDIILKKYGMTDWIHIKDAVD